MVAVRLGVLFSARQGFKPGVQAVAIAKRANISIALNKAAEKGIGRDESNCDSVYKAG